MLAPVMLKAPPKESNALKVSSTLKESSALQESTHKESAPKQNTKEAREGKEASELKSNRRHSKKHPSPTDFQLELEMSQQGSSAQPARLFPNSPMNGSASDSWFGPGFQPSEGVLPENPSSPQSRVLKMASAAKEQPSLDSNLRKLEEMLGDQGEIAEVSELDPKEMRSILGKQAIRDRKSLDGTLSGEDFVSTYLLSAGAVKRPGETTQDQQSVFQSFVTSPGFGDGLDGGDEGVREATETESERQSSTGGSLNWVAGLGGEKSQNGAQLGLSSGDLSASVVAGSVNGGQISAESLARMSGVIQQLSRSGGGEMRIRLHPEHLGELHLRVMTHGVDVGLQIHASDEKAKKILEESLGSLKESLSARHLVLANVELSVLGNATAHLGENVDSNDRGNQGHFGSQQDMQQNQGSNPQFNFNSGPNPHARHAMDQLVNETSAGIRPRSSMNSGSLKNGVNHSFRANNLSYANGRLDVTA